MFWQDVENSKDPHAFIEPCIVLGCEFVTNDILFPFSFNLSELVVFGVAFIAFTELDRGLQKGSQLF